MPSEVVMVLKQSLFRLSNARKKARWEGKAEEES
jgi:hypothetical protein